MIAKARAANAFNVLEGRTEGVKTATPAGRSLRAVRGTELPGPAARDEPKRKQTTETDNGNGQRGTDNEERTAD
jgi:hypothetical protein